MKKVSGTHQLQIIHQRRDRITFRHHLPFSPECFVPVGSSRHRTTHWSATPGRRFRDCLVSLGLHESVARRGSVRSFGISTSLAISLPQTCQPCRLQRANISRRGPSSTCSINHAHSLGLRECVLLCGSLWTEDVSFFLIGGFPFTPTSRNSAEFGAMLPPMFASVLCHTSVCRYRNPHASITRNASGRYLFVVHSHRRQSVSASAATGPTTTARAAWARVKYGGTSGWVAIWT